MNLAVGTEVDNLLLFISQFPIRKLQIELTWCNYSGI